MQPIIVLIAVFVLTFVAGFDWRTGSVAARLVERMLRGRRETSRASQRGQDASEAHRIKTHEADKPARGQSGQTPFFR